MPRASSLQAAAVRRARCCVTVRPGGPAFHHISTPSPPIASHMLTSSRMCCSAAAAPAAAKSLLLQCSAAPSARSSVCRTPTRPAPTTPRIRTMAAAAAAAASAAAAPAAAPPRVLSVQSSVVSGYVGNKAAVFPLQLLGFEVDPINSVQFSNHTGYPLVRGHVFDGSHLTQLLQGLMANGLLGHTHLLTGYIGSLSLLEGVAAVAAALRAANPQLTYVCDPVLGDEGRMYVSRELIDAYRMQIVPLCDVITPNQFEAELLTGLRVASEADALAAAAALHKLGPATVIITSLDALPHPEYGSAEGSSDPAARKQEQPDAAASTSQPEQQQQACGFITLIASTRLPQEPGSPSAFRLRVPKRPGYFTGTGDLLAALLLAWSHRHATRLAQAVELAVAGLQAVLAATAAAQQQAPAAGGDEAERTAAAFRAKELRLVQCAQQLLAPEVLLHTEPLDAPQ